MRYDLFETKKSIHIKLSKEIHASLRQKLFRYGLTMQDLFQEAAEMALLESLRSDKFLHRVAKKKMVMKLEKMDKNHKLELGELDSETLYNLLEENVSEDDNEI